ncbi:hypothetical protein QQX98_004024 [Neonectria punicea]|uniref:Uncharacterized protein n=1 Tax=Neonectria punicea TaxID=979145 RepID=A0ABR1HAS8_9HYPO
MSAKTPNLSSYTAFRSFAAGATRANEAGTRAKAHLERALSEIDGLFAGLSYLDKTESSGLAKERADDLDRELDALSTSAAQQNTNTNGPDPRPQSRRRDWSSIRDVRDGMEHLWKEFDELADELNTDVVNNIRNYYGDAKGLRETGGIAFRNTLTGPAPSDLRKIFALTSLSYVVSCLLRDRNRLAEEDILAGIQVWMNAIQDPEEREAFIALAERLWPEAKNHLHFVPVEMSEDSRRTAASLRRDPWTCMSISDQSINLFPDQPVPFSNSLNITMPVMETYPSPPLPVVSISEPSPSGDAHVLNRTPQQVLENHVYTLTDLTQDSVQWWEFSERSPDIYAGISTLPIASQGGPSVLPPDTGQYLDGPNPIAQGAANDVFADGVTFEVPISPERLQRTTLFTVFFLFLDDLDQLLRNLSGGGMTLKDPSPAYACVQEQQQIKDRINEELMSPLMEEGRSKDASSRGIVSVANRFVSMGYLQTIEEVMLYMSRIAYDIFEVDSAHLEFLDWIFDFRRRTKRCSPPAKSQKTKRPNKGIVKKKADASTTGYRSR